MITKNPSELFTFQGAPVDDGAYDSAHHGEPRRVQVVEGNPVEVCDGSGNSCQSRIQRGHSACRISIVFNGRAFVSMIKFIRLYIQHCYRSIILSTWIMNLFHAVCNDFLQHPRLDVICQGSELKYS